MVKTDSEHNIIQFPKQSGDNKKGYVIKIALRHTKPPIWRKLLIPSDITLNQLHNIIQESMGWFDCHLHSFKIGNKEYGIPDPDFPDDIIDDKEVPLESIFQEVGQKILYIYDYGDDWMHEILLESRKSNPKREAVLLEGKRACPPEDCGGVWGYERILKVLKKKKLTPEEREIMEWLGDGFDPEALDFEEINDSLSERNWIDGDYGEW